MDDISKKEINIIDILFTIKEDVSSIKTDMTNFKETQKLERERFNKELEEQNNVFNKNISDVKKEITKNLSDTESKLQKRITDLTSVQNNIVGDISSLKEEIRNLKQAENNKLAKQWKTIMGFVGTAVCTAIITKLPDIVALFVKG